MKKALYCFLVLLLLGLVLPVTGPAAPMKTQTLEGCVINGVFYATYQKSGARLKPGAGFQQVRLSSVDMWRYEGKRLRVTGGFSAGGQFLFNPKSLQVLGTCNQDTRDAAPAD